MYCLVNNQEIKYPYSFADLRKDNPQVSFPDKLTAELLQQYQVHEVIFKEKPSYDSLVNYLKESEVFESEGKYYLKYIVEKIPVDKAKDQVRRVRDERLADCDWVVSKSYEQGCSVPEAWGEYRKALRDLPAQEGFPYDIVWPIKPE